VPLSPLGHFREPTPLEITTNYGFEVTYVHFLFVLLVLMINNSREFDIFIYKWFNTVFIHGGDEGGEWMSLVQFQESFAYKVATIRGEGVLDFLSVDCVFLGVLLKDLGPAGLFQLFRGSAKGVEEVAIPVLVNVEAHPVLPLGVNVTGVEHTCCR